MEKQNAFMKNNVWTANRSGLGDYIDTGYKIIDWDMQETNK